MNTEAQIKEWAEAGWTRADVAQALGLSLTKLYYYQQSIGFKWPKGRSIGQRQYQRDRKPRGNPERAAAMQAASVAARPHYTVNGVHGTLHSLAKTIGVVAYENVRRRVRLGMSVEDALLTPAQPGSKRWVEKR
jgi:hypothetical protein